MEVKTNACLKICYLLYVVMPHCRTTVTEQNFVTCETNYILKTNGGINTKYKELS